MSEPLTEFNRLITLVHNFVEEQKYNYVISEQMLYVLLDDEKCQKMVLALTTDANKKQTIPQIKEALLEYFDKSMPKVDTPKKIIPTQAYKNYLQSVVAAGNMRATNPTSLHAFLMLFGDKTSASESILSDHGIFEKNVMEYIHNFEKGEFDAFDEDRPNLSKYAIELVNLAKNGKIDPLIGREREVNRIIQILSRKKSNNAILVGEAGVGKSSIAEGLALRIANNKVPKVLANKKIYALNVTTMLAGTKFRGEFEQRLEDTIKECAGADDVIVFIDEIHNICGAGGNSDGSMDASNILKPYLSRGELHIIGATTYDEYKKSIEKDKALARRFKKIDVLEPSADETYQILLGLKSKYEEFHGVQYPDDVLRYAVDLSAKYIVGKFFPDKAIDIVDEIGAKYHSGLKQADSVTKEDVEDVVSATANIAKLTVEQDDKEKLKNLGDAIKENLFGQDDVVDAIVKKVRMSKAGLANVGKPIGSFMFIGSSGCGKTELAKTLANKLGIGFVKLDMSEYQEDYSVSKLVGSSAGYVGYEQDGALTGPLIKNPNCVVLLDEIEKANKCVYDLLLQVLDEGKLTDNHGREASFRNAIVIMTSNVGCANAEQMSSALGFVKTATNESERKQKTIEDAYKKKFSPEFRNRLTGVFYFNQLNNDVLGMIVDKNIKRINNALANKGVSITIDDKARAWFVEKAAKENAGGRPVERIVDSEVSEKVADEVLFGKLVNGGNAIVTIKGDKVKINYVEKLNLSNSEKCVMV